MTACAGTDLSFEISQTFQLGLYSKVADNVIDEPTCRHATTAGLFIEKTKSKKSNDD